MKHIVSFLILFLVANTAFSQILDPVKWDVSVEKGILNFANIIDADVILLNTSGRRGLAHLFTGSIGEDLANHAKLPVITFKV